MVQKIVKPNAYAPSMNPDAAGWAQIDLAALKVDRDELEEAEALLRIAVANADPEIQALQE